MKGKLRPILLKGVGAIEIDRNATDIEAINKSVQKLKEGWQKFTNVQLNRQVLDRVIPVTDADAMETGREMSRREGVLVGISSGAALWAALQLAKEPAHAGKTIVVLLPDTGERYLSTAMFAE